MTKNNSGKTVERFTPATRLGHWVHVIAFLALLITGLALIFTGFGNLFGSAGLKATVSIHRFMAWPFTFLTVVILILGANKSTRRWIKDIFTWKKNDVDFIKAYPKEFFGIKTKLPKQGKYNAGQKVNSLLTIFGSLIMIITGWILYFPNALSPQTVSVALPIHSFFAMVMGAVMLGHAYLGLLHPGSKESIKGMLNGKVSLEYAGSHHALWVEELEADSGSTNNIGSQKEVSL